MFPLEQIMSLIPENHIITILDAYDNRLFVASCPAMIPFKYRDKMVASVVQSVDIDNLKIALKVKNGDISYSDIPTEASKADMLIDETEIEKFISGDQS